MTRTIIGAGSAAAALARIAIKARTFAGVAVAEPTSSALCESVSLVFRRRSIHPCNLVRAFHCAAITTSAATPSGSRNRVGRKPVLVACAQVVISACTMT